MKRTTTKHLPYQSRCRGLSLIEITLVIGLMLALASMVTYSITSMTDWQKGRSASEALKSVYVAQKGFLADHPTKNPTDFTSEKLIPYLPGQATAMPTAKSLDGASLTLDFLAMPPTFQLNGSVYDPTGKSDDGLWDIGNL